MRYLVTGVKGQLGYDIVKELKRRNETEILALDVSEMDITNREQVFDVVTEYKPDVIFHCAAWTAVDKAEDEKELCEKVNVVGTKNMTDASLEVGAKIIYMSTDYVFDGKKEGIGRKLDFIAQEMNREANTILSKANDLEVSNHAIDLKTEIEKVREQIQNIE